MELGGILFGGRRCLESHRSLEQGSELLCHESGRQAGGWERFHIMFFFTLVRTMFVRQVVVSGGEAGGVSLMSSVEVVNGIKIMHFSDFPEHDS